MKLPCSLLRNRQKTLLLSNQSAIFHLYKLPIVQHMEKLVKKLTYMIEFKVCKLKRGLVSIRKQSDQWPMIELLEDSHYDVIKRPYFSFNRGTLQNLLTLFRIVTQVDTSYLVKETMEAAGYFCFVLFRNKLV